MRLDIWFLLVGWLLLTMLVSGCVTPLPTSTCVVEAESGMCWTKRQENLGRALRSMEGEFCLSREDTEKLIQRLNACSNTSDPVVGRGFPSLCVVEAVATTCWVKKSEGAGRAFSQMEGDFCVTRPDMEGILRALNRCANRPSGG